MRGLGVFIEVLILSGLVYCLLNGVRLLLADFGIGPKYDKPIIMFLVAAGSILVIFFIAHLTTFYPPT